MAPTDPVLTGVLSRDVSKFWPHIEGMLADALQDSSWTLDEVAYGLGAKEMQLWLATSPGLGIEAVAVTRITDRGCSVCALTGEEPDRWLHLLSQIEDWAREHGCDRSYFEARRGFERKLPDYRVTRILMEKRLG